MTPEHCRGPNMEAFVTIEELANLESRATAGPWENRFHRKEVTQRDWRHSMPILANCNTFDDGDFIVALRNAAPELLAVAAAAKQLRIIELKRDKDEEEHAAPGMTFNLGHLARAELELDSALSALSKEQP
jgi:hypothetical protein